MTDTLDGRIGEALGGGGAERLPHQRRARAARLGHRRGARSAALASPRPATLPFLVCLGAGTVVHPLTIFVNKTTIDSEDARPDDLGRGAARRRAGRPRRGRRRALDPAEAPEIARARGGLDRPGGARRARRCGAPAARPCEPRSPTRSSRPAAEACARSSSAATTWRTPSTAVTDLRIAAVEIRRYARRPRPAVQRGVGPGAARPDRGDARDRPLRRRARRATRAATTLPDAALLERLLVGARPPAHGGRPRAVRDGRPPRRPAVDRRGRGLGPRRRGRSASRCGGCSAAGRERLLAYASSGELVAPEERARRVAALRDAGVRAVKLRFHHADWREDVAVVEAVRDAVGLDVELMVDANQGWRMAGRPQPAAGTSRPRRSAPARSSRSASTGSRSRSRPHDVDGYARLRGRHVAADRRRRDGAQPARGARPRAARRRRRGAARRRARRRHRRLPPDRRRWPTCAAACSRRTPGRTGSAWSPTCTWRSPSSTCPYVEVPLDPPAWTPAAARLAARRPGRRDRGRRDDRPAARSRPGRDARPRRARGAPHRHEDRAPPCCTPTATPLEVCELELDAPQAGEVLVRVAAAGVCHSDLHLADGHLGEGRHPIVLGHEGAGVVEAVGDGRDGRRTRATRSRSASSRRAARCSACTAGRRNLCEVGGRGVLGGDAARRDARACALPDGRAGPALQLRLLLRRALRRARGVRRPGPADAAALAGGAARLRRGDGGRRGAQRRSRAQRGDASA